MNNADGIVRVEDDPIFKVRNCQIVLTAETVDLPEERLASAFARIQPDRGRSQCPMPAALTRIGRIAVAVLDQQ